MADKAWAGYSARYGRGQSVEQLAQRGGFGWCEMDTFFPGWREATDEWRKLREDLAEARATIERLRAPLESIEEALVPVVIEALRQVLRGERPFSGACAPSTSSSSVS
ncbi:hypothetical protein [Archangium lansingense]|uniref:Uncharacterized protein n=1 Tax=Archangium lansingense TaxID=2995310 RepID=A0ABT4AF56_9BACT|nr:hypothetical protein [Archangium lansinium]MCY1080303.1 hypothetical protein [Archangium lansinium]